MTPQDRNRLTNGAILAIGFLGLALRVYIALQSNGSNDFYIWLAHAALLRDHGFVWAYSHTGEGTPFQLYNHPPLPGLYALLCKSLAGENDHVFTVLFKIPPLCAEIFAALLLRNIWQRRSGARAGAIAFAAYGFALGSIAVSAYHCNTDAVSAALALFACERSERQRHGSAGLALAAAMSVKLIPIFIAPVLFFRARSWKQKGRLVLGASAALVPYLPFITHFGVIAKATFGYAPRLEHWGIPYLLEMLATDLPHFGSTFTDARMFMIAHGKDFILLAALAAGLLAKWNRRMSAYSGASIAMLAFLVFSPGFGVQYVIAVAPVLFAYDVGFGFVYATLSGIFVTLVYLAFLVPNGPPYISFFNSWYAAGPSAVGIIAWAYCVSLLTKIPAREIRGR